ncbi:hypothetical protein KUV85_02710 [Nocardioides panacisoli]|uniref:LOG family protein n=1 Tax=Nocardioides panacisoli TaxID=627624 RepID=UPI001C63B1D4|nr:hypothetical protein [Nocardioides panacisoli]QYJ04608.1 hypothetical protein KUV85_02710 [Nocardioides panacisoli]
MQHTRGQVVVVESLAELDRRLAAGARHLTGWRLTGVDLRERSRELANCDTTRTTFAGCTFAPGDDHLHRVRGALVLPAVHQAPIDPHRSELYGVAELYDAPAWRDSLDGRAYAWLQTAHERDAVLARVLHDQGIDTALRRWTDGRDVVGVMGGHAWARDRAAYADAARLGRLLGRTHTVATGGGPGAMEAANLGARLGTAPEGALADALATLARVPSFHPDVDAWVASAAAVRDGLDATAETLGVPTWHYGHEPPNLFATSVAKYFRNALRESILLQVCNAGIVFLPGAAGTVQEVFQDACENYYASEDAVAPMVLVGRAHWTEELPAWPLLESLARGRAMADHVHLVDTVEEAAALFE